MARANANQLIQQSGNRKPRVHIKYETWIGDAMQLVELPFVVGVMADLSGANRPEDSLADRSFTDFSAAKFGDRMKSLKPRVNMLVPSTLPGKEGDLRVDITFESMDDFSPEAIARKVKPLRLLLENRERLKNLAVHLDGKDTEQLEAILANPALLAAMASAPPPPDTPSGDAGAGDAPQENA